MASITPTSADEAAKLTSNGDSTDDSCFRIQKVQWYCLQCNISPCYKCMIDCPVACCAFGTGWASALEITSALTNAGYVWCAAPPIICCCLFVPAAVTVGYLFGYEVHKDKANQ